MIWEIVTLGSLCSLVTKGTTPTSIGLSFSDGGVPFLRIQNIDDRTVHLENVLYIDKESNKVLKRSIIRPKDFLITIAGTIGKVAIVPDDFPECNCNQAVAILRFDEKELNSRFLLNWLSTQEALGQVSGKKVTGTISNLSLGNIKALKIPFPPLEEQKKIAEILDAADSLRQKDQQLIEHYTALSQSLFLDMFGDPVSNPKGWGIVKWEDCLTIRNGKSQKKVVNPDGEYPIYGSGGVMGFANDYLCESDTVIIGRKGSINKPIYVDEKFWNVDTAFGLISGDDLNSKYLFNFCLRYNFLKHNKATTLPSLTKADLLKISMPCPPIKIQNQFDERNKIIEKQKQQAEQNLAKSEELFSSLLQRAFKGELTQSKVA